MVVYLRARDTDVGVPGLPQNMTGTKFDPSVSFCMGGTVEAHRGYLKVVPKPVSWAQSESSQSTCENQKKSVLDSVSKLGSALNAEGESPAGFHSLKAEV